MFNGHALLFSIFILLLPSFFKMIIIAPRKEASNSDCASNPIGHLSLCVCHNASLG